MNSAELFLWILNNLNYWVVTLFMAIESSFVPFPSEVVVPPAAWKAMDPDSGMTFILVIVFATVGANIGALINYYLAKWLLLPRTWCCVYILRPSGSCRTTAHQYSCRTLGHAPWQVPSVHHTRCWMLEHGARSYRLGNIQVHQLQDNTRRLSASGEVQPRNRICIAGSCSNCSSIPGI